MNVICSLTKIWPFLSTLNQILDNDVSNNCMICKNNSDQLYLDSFRQFICCDLSIFIKFA